MTRIFMAVLVSIYYEVWISISIILSDKWHCNTMDWGRRLEQVGVWNLPGASGGGDWWGTNVRQDGGPTSCVNHRGRIVSPEIANVWLKICRPGAVLVENIHPSWAAWSSAPSPPHSCQYVRSCAQSDYDSVPVRRRLPVGWLHKAGPLCNQIDVIQKFTTS